MLAQGFADAVNGLTQSCEDDDSGHIFSLPRSCMLLEVLPHYAKQGGHLWVSCRGLHQIVQAHLELHRYLAYQHLDALKSQSAIVQAPQLFIMELKHCTEQPVQRRCDTLMLCFAPARIAQQDATH